LRVLWRGFAFLHLRAANETLTKLLEALLGVGTKDKRFCQFHSNTSNQPIT
jgi:hypothetical protein